MNLYNGILEDTWKVLEGLESSNSPFDGALLWRDLGRSELVMMRDAAFELGGSGNPSVNYTLISSDAEITSGVTVVGPDLNGIKQDTAFARIVLLKTEDLGEGEETYDRIRSMEYVRYHVFPEGYMVRVSSASYEEQVRISKEAIAHGISFCKVGSCYIQKYLDIPGVLAARVIFVTLKESVAALKGNAKKADDITKTLTHILDGLPTDCGHCEMKKICDEVEGVREMHMGMAGGKKTNV